MGPVPAHSHVTIVGSAKKMAVATTTVNASLVLLVHTAMCQQTHAVPHRARMESASLCVQARMMEDTSVTAQKDFKAVSGCLYVSFIGVYLGC